MCMGADEGVQPGSDRKPGMGHIQEQADRLGDPRAKTRVAAVEIIDAHIGILEGERGGVVAVPVWQCVQNRQHQAGPPDQQLRFGIASELNIRRADFLQHDGIHHVTDGIRR